MNRSTVFEITDMRGSSKNAFNMPKSVERSTAFKYRLIYLLTFCLSLLSIYLVSVRDYLSADLRRMPSTHGTKAFITLFTSVDGTEEKAAVRLNTLRNWSLMQPEANLVLFVVEADDGAAVAGDGSLRTLSSAAISLGWTVVPVGRVSESGKPFVKEMYRVAMERYDTPLYGFVSADILFDDGLLKTLRLVRTELPFLGPTLVTGRRWNVFIDKNKLVYNFSDVAQLAKENGQLYRADALDYFITSRDYPWQEFADDVTVGRPAFDNYITAVAVLHKMNVVDATASITALHQNTIPLKESGVSASLYTDRHNLLVIGNDFDYNKGSTLIANYKTRLTPSGLVDLREK